MKMDGNICCRLRTIKLKYNRTSRERPPLAVAVSPLVGCKGTSPSPEPRPTLTCPTPLGPLGLAASPRTPLRPESPLVGEEGNISFPKTLPRSALRASLLLLRASLTPQQPHLGATPFGYRCSPFWPYGRGASALRAVADMGT